MFYGEISDLIWSIITVKYNAKYCTIAITIFYNKFERRKEQNKTNWRRTVNWLFSIVIAERYRLDLILTKMHENDINLHRKFRAATDKYSKICTSVHVNCVSNKRIYPFFIHVVSTDCTKCHLMFCFLSLENLYLNLRFTRKTEKEKEEFLACCYCFFFLFFALHCIALQLSSSHFAQIC